MAAQPGQPRPQFDDVPLPPAYANGSFADDDIDDFDDADPPPPSHTIRGPISVVNTQDYGSGGRRPIPVPSISQGMVPFSGLHLLAGLEQVEIQQTVELEDLLASVESENRYVVRSVRPSASGETLLVAGESSSQWQRRCLGSGRALRLRVYDPSQQETLHLSRRLACRLGLLGCCYLQAVDVLLPPGRPLGSVTQAWTLLVPVLEVRNAVGDVLYRVEGPSPLAGPPPWSSAVETVTFKISSRDGLVQLGSICHQWKASVSSFVTSVHFPSADLDIHHKALILSAAFLLEYMFFERAKKRSWIPCSFCCC